MIMPDLELKPVLIPHHKGRKRLHLGKMLNLFPLTFLPSSPQKTVSINIFNKSASTFELLILNSDTVKCRHSGLK